MASTLHLMSRKNPREVLEETFRHYTKFSKQSYGIACLDRSKFAKLCRDSELLGRECTAVDVDVIFSRVTRRNMKMDFQDFADALTLVAYKRYPYTPSVERNLLKVVAKLEVCLRSAIPTHIL